MSTASIDQDELVQFLYQCPVGIAQIESSGAISLLNAKGSQLLMPIAGRSGLENLFDILDPHDPTLRALLDDTSGSYGNLCEQRVVRIESTDHLPVGDRHLSITMLKVGSDTVMAVFEDVTRAVGAEAEARELLTTAAIEVGRSELAAEVLHDIGNAVVGIGTRTATLLEDSQWTELVQLEKLGTFLGTRKDSLTQAIGAKKADALLNLIGEVHASLEGRRQRTEESMQAFTASVHHIQEILNLHRHYARQSVQGGRERVSIRVITEDALTIQAAGFEKRGIAIERRMAPDLPKLSLDRTRMIQVIGNLLKNACEAFDARGPAADRRIILETRRSSDDAGVCLEIRDNACGFEPERAESLFEKDTSTKNRGSGIGLYHCRKVSEGHGGTLVLRSDGPGLGATSILTLPVSPKPEPDRADRVEHASPGR